MEDRMQIREVSLLSLGRSRKGSGRMRIGIGLVLLFWLASSSLSSAEPCRAPESMRSSLQGHPTAETFADLGIWFGEQKKYACAADAFAASLRIQPNSANVTFMFGVSLFLSGNAEDAVTALQVSEEIDPRNPKLHPVLAAAFDALHQTKKAEAEWHAALAIDPESSDALDALSRDFILDGNSSEMIALLENPIIRGQRTAVQSLNLGLAYARGAKPEESVRVLRDGLNTSPDSLALANELADVLVQLDQPEQASSVLSLALTVHPGDRDTGIRYLRTLVATHSEKARQVGEQLLLSAPQNGEVLYLNGVLEMQEGRLQEARTHLEKSVALDPNVAISHRVLGALLFQLTDMSGAREQFDKAIALGDNSPEIQDKRSKTLQSLGEGH